MFSLKMFPVVPMVIGFIHCDIQPFRIQAHLVKSLKSFSKENAYLEFNDGKTPTCVWYITQR